MSRHDPARATHSQDSCTPADVIARVLTVPSSARTFQVVPGDEPFRQYGIPPELLKELLDLGLPAKRAGGRLFFDARDLANVALSLRLPSLQRHTMTVWARTLKFVAERPWAEFDLSYNAWCDRCGEGEAGPFQVLVSSDRWTSISRGRPYPMHVKRPVAWPALPAQAEAIAQAVADLWFFSLPPALLTDVGFVRENRLAGCYGAARLMMEEGRELDLDLRQRYGLLLSPPYSDAHAWTEVRVDDVWAPFDPHLLRTLTRVADLDPDEWPSMRSPGAILLPLAPDRCEVARHNGHDARASAATRIRNRVTVKVRRP